MSIITWGIFYILVGAPVREDFPFQIPCRNVLVSGEGIFLWAFAATTNTMVEVIFWAKAGRR